MPTGLKSAAMLLLAFMIVLLTSPASADDRRPPREAKSENGRFILRLRINRSTQESGAGCTAELYERLTERRTPRRIWREKLVNETAPAQILIHNSGRYVVTLDEFRRGGAAHAVVVYNEKGALQRDFDLRELLQKEDWQHVKTAERKLDWLTDAGCAFVDEPPQLTIRLKWGREIRIDLRTLEIAGREGSRAASAAGKDKQSKNKSNTHAQYDTAGIPPEILALFDAPAGDGDLASTAAGTTNPADAGAASQPTGAFSEEVYQALAQLQKLAQTAEDQRNSDLPGVISEDGSQNADAESIAAQNQLGAEVENSQYAGNSAAAGLGVPLPDPAHPVDYVAWVLAQTQTDGPDAAVVYQAARDQHVEWTGSEELLAAAQRGDPDALASPEINAWIDANREALATLRSATQYQYHGAIEISPEEQSMMGVLLPNLSSTRDLVRIGVLEAKQYELAGDYEAAALTYMDNLAIGSQVSHGATLIENLVGMAIHRVTSDSLLDSFAAAGADDNIDYGALADALEANYQPTQSLATSFQGERAMYFEMLQKTYDWNSDTNSYRVADSAPELITRTFGFLSEDSQQDASPIALAMCYSLGAIGFENMVSQANDYYDQVTNAAMLPYAQGKQELDRIEGQIENPGFRMRNPLMVSLLPSLRRCTQVAARNESARNAARLITNLKAYRQQFGAYPESLDVFGDSDMTYDAYGGGRFGYVHQGDDFELYSLGENGVDDGGVHDDRGEKNDMRFWPRPPKK